jgi:hypothetical protein
MRATLRKKCAVRSGLLRAATELFRTIRLPILIELHSEPRAKMNFAVNRYDFST